MLEFKVHAVRSLTIAKNLKNLMIINGRFLIAISNEHHVESLSFAIWDLQQSNVAPRSILQKYAAYFSDINRDAEIQDAGKNRILYIKKISSHNGPLTLCLYSLEACKELASFEINVPFMQYMQTIDESRLFIITQEEGCYILNFDSGSLEQYPQFNSYGSDFMVTGRSLTPLIACMRSDKNGRKELRMYNILTRQDIRATTLALPEVKRYSDQHHNFAFLSSTIFAIGVEKDLRFLDTVSGNYIGTYESAFSDICLVGSDKVATISYAYVGEAQVKVWNCKSKACLQTLSLPLSQWDTLSIAYDPTADLLYATVDMTVYAIKYRAPDLAPDIAVMLDDTSSTSFQK